MTFGRSRVSVRLGVRACRDVGSRACNEESTGVVRGSSIPVERDGVPLRGVHSGAVERWAVTAAIAAVVLFGMPIGFALIFSSGHVVPSSGERMRIVLPRPQNDAIRGNVCVITDES